MLFHNYRASCGIAFGAHVQRVRPPSVPLSVGFPLFVVQPLVPPPPRFISNSVIVISSDDSEEEEDKENRPGGYGRKWPHMVAIFVQLQVYQNPILNSPKIGPNIFFLNFFLFNW